MVSIEPNGSGGLMWYLAVAFIVTLLALVILLKTRLAAMALDQPNQRSLHTKVTPRTGGLAIMAGVIAAWPLLGHIGVFMIPLVVLMAVSLIDDIRGLPVHWRLLAQLVLSAGFVAAVMPDDPWWLMFPVVLAITWMINLYNFMDGSDGLAGGMAVFGFGFYALAAYLASDVQLAWMSGSIAAAALAFLLFNFYPARIFMGDAGSVPLGFLAGSIGLYGWQHGNWPLWLPILVFSPFIVDATATLLKRALGRERVWQAHRSHYYQRLVQMGWGHKKTAIAEYVLMAAAGLSGLSILQHGHALTAAVLIVWVWIYGLILYKVDRAWLAYKRTDFH